MTNQLYPSYQHTQKGPWHFLLYGFGVLMLAIGCLLPVPLVVSIVLPAVGVIMLVLGTCFHHLTVADDGDGLAIQFGPLPLFRKRINYNAIQTVDIGRTTLLDGWGIHLSMKGGWVWNISGRDCVVIRHGETTHLGTDEPENLAAFLKTKIPGTTDR